jgi:hypothetical protein
MDKYVEFQSWTSRLISTREFNSFGSYCPIPSNFSIIAGHEMDKTVAEIVRKYEMAPLDPDHLGDERLNLFLYKSNMMM